jgi:hypothetical protein
MQVVELDAPSWSTVFEWLATYGEHSPDLCDAQLAVLAPRISASIWSYDSEFRDLWRAPDGRRLPVLPKETRPRKRRTTRK